MNYDRGHDPHSSGESFVAKFIKSNTNKETINVFDVGANTGQYVKMFLSAIEQDARFHFFCFEPQSSVFLQLKNEVAGVQGVTVLNFGFGSESASLPIFSREGYSNYASMFSANYIQHGINLDSQENVRIIRIDDFLHQLGNIHVDLLKIDVEGFELEVLKGAMKSIEEKRIDIIQFEFGFTSIEARIFLKDFFQILDEYKIFRILPRGFVQIHYHEYAELFLTTNYLAIRNDYKISEEWKKYFQ